jgi:hypothetical protein
MHHDLGYFDDEPCHNRRHRGIKRCRADKTIEVLAMQFKDVVTDRAQFRELMGEPPPPCVAKTIAIMDRHCRAFIEQIALCSDCLGERPRTDGYFP